MKRCKNCKHFKGEKNQTFGMCEAHKMDVNRSGRCSSFEEKSYVKPELWGKESEVATE